MVKKYYILLFTIGFFIFLIFLKQGKITNPFIKKTSLISLTLEKVNKIEIDAQGKKTVLKKKNQSWVIASLKDFPAKTEEISYFLKTLSEIKNPEVVSVNPKKQAIYEVNEKKGTKVTLYRDKQKEELFFGKTGPSSFGIYLRPGKKNEVYLVSDNLSNFVSLDDFRNLTILKTDSDKIKKLTFKTKDGEFSLEKKNTKNKEEKWFLKDKELDQSKVKDFLTSISTISAVDGFIDSKKETGLINPQLSLTIMENGQPTKILQIGNPVKDEENPNYYSNLKGSSIIYIVSSVSFKDLQKTEADF